MVVVNAVLRPLQPLASRESCNSIHHKGSEYGGGGGGEGEGDGGGSMMSVGEVVVGFLVASAVVWVMGAIRKRFYHQ